MWMRSRAACKGLLHKLRLCDSCVVNADGFKEGVMAKVIEFYVPKKFRKPVKWAPQLQLGRVIEFCSMTKKSA
jgi:hypothetical protein